MKKFLGIHLVTRDGIMELAAVSSLTGVAKRVKVAVSTVNWISTVEHPLTEPYARFMFPGAVPGAIRSVGRKQFYKVVTVEDAVFDRLEVVEYTKETEPKVADEKKKRRGAGGNARKKVRG